MRLRKKHSVRLAQKQKGCPVIGHPNLIIKEIFDFGFYKEEIIPRECS